MGVTFFPSTLNGPDSIIWISLLSVHEGATTLTYHALTWFLKCILNGYEMLALSHQWQAYTGPTKATQQQLKALPWISNVFDMFDFLWTCENCFKCVGLNANFATHCTNTTQTWWPVKRSFVHWGRVWVQKPYKQVRLEENWSAFHVLQFMRTFLSFTQTLSQQSDYLSMLTYTKKKKSLEQLVWPTLQYTTDLHYCTFVLQLVQN